MTLLSHVCTSSELSNFRNIGIEGKSVYEFIAILLKGNTDKSLNYNSKTFVRTLLLVFIPYCLLTT